MSDEFFGSIHTKKEKKIDKREYLEFTPQHAVPPVLAYIFVMGGIALMGVVSYQVWEMGIEALKIVAVAMWCIITFMGMILWRALYRRKVRVYPAKVVVYGIFLTNELLISNIMGFKYLNPNNLYLKHRHNSGKTLVNLEVNGRQYLEDWIQTGFTDLGKLESGN